MEVKDIIALYKCINLADKKHGIDALKKGGEKGGNGGAKNLDLYG